MTGAELLLKVLRGIDTQLDAGHARSTGLCAWVTCELQALTDYCDDFDSAEELYDIMLETWPETSGNDWYPVPCPEQYLKEHCPEEFDDFGCADDAVLCAAVAYDHLPSRLYYDPDSPYGAARLRLLAWLIAELENKQ